MKILIDGPDGTGKTTVCRILSEKLQWDVVKMPDSKEYHEAGTIEEFSKFFNKILIQFEETNLILDRGFTSSLVYSEVYSRPADLKYLREIEELLNAKVFILTAKDEVLFSRRPHDEMVDRSKRVKVNQVFRKLAKDRGFYLIETDDSTSEEVADQILKILNG